MYSVIVLTIGIGSDRIKYQLHDPPVSLPNLSDLTRNGVNSSLNMKIGRRGSSQTERSGYKYDFSYEHDYPTPDAIIAFPNPTPTITRQASTSSTTSSTSTFSTFSSASSLARSRANAPAPSLDFPLTSSYQVHDTLPEELDQTPKLLSRDGNDGRAVLEWEPDPEDQGMDEAEIAWRRLELKLKGKTGSGRTIRRQQRGRWVLRDVEEQFQPDEYCREEYDQRDWNGDENRNSLLVTDSQHISRHMYDDNANLSLEDTDFQATNTSAEMDRQTSAFSVSAYFQFGENVDGTALFDMSAPLIPSRQGPPCTPQNTPIVRSDTLYRAQRVRRSVKNATGLGDSNVTTEYRLDVQIMNALSGLHETNFDTPLLDQALGSTTFKDIAYEKFTERSDRSEQGLGLGLPIQLATVYNLPILSPNLRTQLRGYTFDEPERGGLGDEEEGNAQCPTLRVTNLDTGHRCEVGLQDLERGEIDLYNAAKVL